MDEEKKDTAYGNCTPIILLGVLWTLVIVLIILVVMFHEYIP